MLIVNMLAQLSVVWLQTTKGPKATMAKDMIYVVSAVKPGVDAWRVATGQDQNEYQVLTPKMELLISKYCELVFEAIPGCVVQVQAYLFAMGNEEGASQQALVSLAISALSTGFTAASITHDFVSRPLLTQFTSTTPHSSLTPSPSPPVPAGRVRGRSPRRP
jgi:hypothetical protein